MTTTKLSLDIPARTSLLSRRGWSALMLVSLTVCTGVPVCALLVLEGSPLHLLAHALTLVGKIIRYALTMLVLDLAWGYCSILGLGHGLFFVLGGYGMGMYLVRSIGREGVYESDLPDSMVFLDWKELPWFQHDTEHFAWATLLAVLVSGVLVWLFGSFAFRPRVEGVYLPIIMQAMTYAATLLFFRNEAGFGGNNGFTDFKRIPGFPISALLTRTVLFVAMFVVLVLAFIACRAIVTSKFGRTVTAIRDVEVRVMFPGYSPFDYKLSVWTFSAVLCGIAGVFYMPQVDIINLGEMPSGNSIEMAVRAAVGGRGTLTGPVTGAFLVNEAGTLLIVWVSEYWLFAFGVIFVLVTLYLPNGALGLMSKLCMKKRVPARAKVYEAATVIGDHV